MSTLDIIMAVFAVCMVLVCYALFRVRKAPYLADEAEDLHTPCERAGKQRHAEHSWSNQ